MSFVGKTKEQFDACLIHFWACHKLVILKKRIDQSKMFVGKNKLFNAIDIYIISAGTTPAL